jgi:tripartite-type tricarboxylate transporter receptor subunit TctC
LSDEKKGGKKMVSAKNEYRRLIPFLISCLVLVWGMLSVVGAQDKYPNPSRSIDLIIAFAPGGVTDVTGRIFADEFSKVIGIPVAPVNKSGGSGTYGATLVAKSNPDGYTLLANTISGMVLSPSILPQVEFDTVKDFFHIALISNMPDCLLVKSDSPFKTVNDLIEAAQKSPGKISYCTAGVGSDGNFNGEILATSTKTKFKHVPFKGGGEVATAVMGGHIDFGISAATNFIPLEKAGKLRLLAVTGRTRMKPIPHVPTFLDAGIRGEFINNWSGVFAPVKTPKAILDIIVASTEKVLKSKEFVEKIEKSGGEIEYNTPAAFKAMIERDRKTAVDVAQKAGMKVQN